MDVLEREAGAGERTRGAIPWERLLWYLVFGAAFGFTEAAVVAYLRRLLGEAPGLDYREIFAAKGLPFSSAAIAADFARAGLLTPERCREMGTLLMLLGVAMAGGRSAKERLAVFLFTFAVWDLAYYAFLVPLTGFPRGLGQTDIYFLVPFAWYGPVWFPVVVVMP
nr:hypothetical protein [Armatimonadota bacterium]